ncbi:MAG: hypothetical protein PVJ76_21450 [Gemmatimonadota bacterium]
MPEISVLLTAGKVLSGVAILLSLLAIWNVWRRKGFPKVAYGGISLSQKRLRWVWFLILVGAFGFGINEDPIAVASHSTGGDREGVAISNSRTVTVNLPLPFYRFDRERVYEDGELVREEIQEGFVIPGPLLSALLAYLILVVRWDSSSRLARRILKGRKWEEEEWDS